MKKIMMMMVMMLTIVVSTSGNNYTHRDRKCPVSIEQKCYMEHARNCRCNCHNKSWRAANNMTCKTCRKHIKKIQKQHEKIRKQHEKIRRQHEKIRKQHEKHVCEMKRYCGHARR